jgi:hypothetical protein
MWISYAKRIWSSGMNQTPYQRLTSLGVEDQLISLVLGFIPVTPDRYFSLICDVGKLFLDCKNARMATCYLLLFHFYVYPCLFLCSLNCYVTLLCCVLYVCDSQPRRIRDLILGPGKGGWGWWCKETMKLLVA